MLVAGLRDAGHSAARRLARFGADVLACDDAEVAADDLEAAWIKVHTGGTPPEPLEDPGVTWTPQEGAG